MNYRERIKDKKRIVIKIGSSSLQHAETGDMDYGKIEKLVRILCDIKNRGIDVVLVSSGAIACGKKMINVSDYKGLNPEEMMATKQACSAIGQAKLMMIYQKLFAEYNQLTAQVLLTKNTIIDELSRFNAKNTFKKLLELGVISVVNENDTVSTHEIEIGDNDTLSAIVAALIDADLLILLSDIDGLYTDDPRSNPNAEFIDTVPSLDEHFMKMGKSTSGSSVGTGGMSTKLLAGMIATQSGADMIIANSKDINILRDIMDCKNIGTYFVARKDSSFSIPEYFEQNGN